MNHPELCTIFMLTRKHRFSAADLAEAVRAALPGASEDEIKALQYELQEIMADIGEHFRTVIDPTNLHSIPSAQLKNWLADNYPWVDDETLEGAYKEGLAYAAC